MPENMKTLVKNGNISKNGKKTKGGYEFGDLNVKVGFGIEKKLFSLLELCVSSLPRGHANLLCIVPILTDEPKLEACTIRIKYNRHYEK
jgi:hypothetical protein